VGRGESLTHELRNSKDHAQPLRLTADAQDLLFGTAKPTLTYRLGVRGLVDGETLGTGLASTATSASSVGAGPIGLGHLGTSSSAIA
jgi:hypothetical protein